MIILFLFNFNSSTSFLSRLVRMVKSKLPDAVLPEIPLHQLIFANLKQHADKISFVSIKDEVICNSFKAYSRADKAETI